MGKLPMSKSYQAYAVVVLALIGLFGLGYTVYANQSTISSLKSEVTTKDNLIASNNRIIQNQNKMIAEKNAIIGKQRESIALNNKTIVQLKYDINASIKRRASISEQLPTKKSIVKLPTTQIKSVVAIRLAGHTQSGWTITFYNAGVASTGKRPGDRDYGMTRSGKRVQDGVTAACPRTTAFFPNMKKGDYSHGKKVYIEDVGLRTCHDTGGAITGKHIDVYVAKPDKTLLSTSYGKKINVNIRIIDPI